MAYLHKKFKKYAAAQAGASEAGESADDSSAPRHSSDSSAPRHSSDSSELRHSVGSLVNDSGTNDNQSEDSIGRSTPLPSQKSLAPRQYYCDICRIAFRLKENLNKHLTLRSHKLKAEKGISSSDHEMIKELGVQGKVELDTPVTDSPVPSPGSPPDQPPAPSPSARSHVRSNSQGAPPSPSGLQNTGAPSGHLKRKASGESIDRESYHHATSSHLLSRENHETSSLQINRENHSSSSGSSTSASASSSSAPSSSMTNRQTKDPAFDSRYLKDYPPARYSPHERNPLPHPVDKRSLTALELSRYPHPSYLQQVHPSELSRFTGSHPHLDLSRIPGHLQHPLHPRLSHPDPLRLALHQQQVEHPRVRHPHLPDPQFVHPLFPERSQLPKEHSRVPQEHSRGPLEHSRISQEHSRLPKEPSRLPQELPRLPKEHSRLPLEHSRLTLDQSGLPLEHLRVPMEHARLTQEHSRLPQEHLGFSKEHSRLLQEHATNSRIVQTEQPDYPRDQTVQLVHRDHLVNREFSHQSTSERISYSKQINTTFASAFKGSSGRQEAEPPVTLRPRPYISGGAGSSSGEKPPPRSLTQSSLEKRINEVISQNQAIVETMDPLWKGRYMRQSSREAKESGTAANLQSTSSASSQPGESSESDMRKVGRRYSGTGLPITEGANSSSQENTLSEANQRSSDHPRVVSLGPGVKDRLVQLQAKQQQQQHQQQSNAPPQQQLSRIGSSNHEQVSDQRSDIPLNLSDTAARKETVNVPVTGDSVKEVWLNSQRKSVNISQMEDITSQIEAGLKSSENPFHPDNPEGSIIKDLLLKTRAGLVSSQVLAELQDKPRGQEDLRDHIENESTSSKNPGQVVTMSHVPAETKMASVTRTDEAPMPRNFSNSTLPPLSSDQLFKCTRCQGTFKSIEDHQIHYCKGLSLSIPENPGRNPHPQSASPSPYSLTPTDNNNGKRRDSFQLPSPKRARSDSSGSGPKSDGLLQIVPNQIRFSSENEIKGVPVPNLSGVLTGIKATPLFSLPGVRTDTSQTNHHHLVSSLPQSSSGSSQAPVLSLPGQPLSLSFTSTPSNKSPQGSSTQQPVFLTASANSTSSRSAAGQFTSVRYMSGGLQQIMPRPVLTVEASSTGYQQPSPGYSAGQSPIAGGRFPLPPPSGHHVIISGSGLPGLPAHSSGLPGIIKPSQSNQLVTLVQPSSSNSPLNRPQVPTLSSTDKLSLQPSVTSCLSINTGFGVSVCVPLNLPNQIPARVPDNNIFIKPDQSSQPLINIDTRQPRLLSPVTPKQQSEGGGAPRPQSLALGGPPSARKKMTLVGSSLISPETPRPKKPYILHYQNGTAYTYLGFKCSTRVFFCSIHKPQPNYVELEKNSRVSMYSNWNTQKDSHPSGLAPALGMASYNSSCKGSENGVFSHAGGKLEMLTSHSSTWKDRKENKSKSEDEGGVKAVTTVEGGYKSTDDNYTYIRGRGRGKYICQTCGIRCKKPSMLKKHIRTHTNVRPFTCKYCNFSFKTKGNLTKHMKSKAHSKKCVELGIVPVPTSADDPQGEDSSKSATEIILAGDSDDSDDDNEDVEEEEEEEGEERFDDADVKPLLPDLAASSSSYHHQAGGPGAALGLAPRVPRFSTYPFRPVSAESNESGPTRGNIELQQDQERVNRITQLARGVEDQMMEIKQEPEFPEISASATSTTILNTRPCLSYIGGGGLILNSTLTPASTTLPTFSFATSGLPAITSHTSMSGPQGNTAKFNVASMSSLMPRSSIDHSFSVQMSLKSEEPSLPPVSPKNYSSTHMNHSGTPSSHHVSISNIPASFTSLPGSHMTISSSQTFIPGKPSNPYIPVAPVNQAFIPSLTNNLALIPSSSTNLVYSTRLPQHPYSQPGGFQDRPPGIQPTKPAGQHSPQKNKVAPSNISPENITIKEEPEDPSNLQQTASTTTNSLQQPPMTSSPIKKIAPKEEKIMPKEREGKKDFIHNFGQLDPVPQNVTMNVRDIPSIAPGSQPAAPPPMPEFSIPQQVVSRADSPARRPGTGAQSHPPTSVGSMQSQPAGGDQNAVPAKSRQNETSNRTDSPTSGSSAENDEGVATKQIEIFQVNEEGKSVCGICNKVFSKSSQLRLHVNIHYFERPFRCDACAVSFRTKGHLQKHKRSVGHYNKVSINATFGAPSTDNPRPFKCADCMIAFRIHGHLAKHLRSKMHIMKLECLGKLPIGMFAEMERLGTNLNDIDTTDCDYSLESLQQMAVKLYEKDPSKLTTVEDRVPLSTGSDISEDEDSNHAAGGQLTVHTAGGPGTGSAVGGPPTGPGADLIANEKAVGNIQNIETNQKVAESEVTVKLEPDVEDMSRPLNEEPRSLESNRMPEQAVTGHDSIPTRRTPESSLNSSGSGSSFRPVNPSSTTISSRRTPEETGKIRLIPESYQYQPSTPTRRGGLSPDEYNKLRGTNNIQQMLPSPKQHQAPLHQHQQTPPPHHQQGLTDEGGRHRPMPHDLKVYKMAAAGSGGGGVDPHLRHEYNKSPNTVMYKHSPQHPRLDPQQLPHSRLELLQPQRSRLELQQQPQHSRLELQQPSAQHSRLELHQPSQHTLQQPSKHSRLELQQPSQHSLQQPSQQHSRLELQHQQHPSAVSTHKLAFPVKVDNLQSSYPEGRPSVPASGRPGIPVPGRSAIPANMANSRPEDLNKYPSPPQSGNLYHENIHPAMRSGPGLEWRGPALSYTAPPGTGSRPVYSASPGGSSTPPGAGGRPIYAPSGGASTPPGRPLYAPPGGSATPPGSVGRPLYGPQGGGLTVRMPPLPGHQPQMISVGGIPGPRSYLVQAPPGAPGSQPSPSAQAAPGGQMLETIVCHICNQQVPKHVIQQHLAGHAKPRPYICPQCDAGFSTPTQLQAHVKLHNQE